MRNPGLVAVVMFCFALALVSQGVVLTLARTNTVALVQPVAGVDGGTVAVQRSAAGPAASQVAIRQPGTNGGGCYNCNSVHPLENPAPPSDLRVLQSRLPTSQPGRRGAPSAICQSPRPCYPA
jgi:K+-transporting ATPase A subunit